MLASSDPRGGMPGVAGSQAVAQPVVIWEGWKAFFTMQGQPAWEVCRPDRRPAMRHLRARLTPSFSHSLLSHSPYVTAPCPPCGSPQDSAAERKRRLTLQRLIESLRNALGGDARRLISWFAARDRPNPTGRVSFSEFVAGLRAHGVLLSDADAALAAVEIDPVGGGTSLAYAKLTELLAPRYVACQMPG